MEAQVSAGGATCEWVDVDSDPELVARYGDEVPVLLVNGRKAFKYRVAPQALRKRIRSERRRAAARWLRSRIGGGGR